ncbi:MAG: NAD(P)H-dependent oxidoreductase subunit E [Clostridia bacterium]|nr:NAD(P)H-dependent oxidoreductase subunit E [Clostridia bacterium]
MSWLEEAPAIIARYPQKRSALLPLLHRVQEEKGFIDTEAMRQVADLLGETPAFVASVVSFYHLLRRHPVGRYHIQVCRGISCMLCGGEELLEHVARRLGVPPGQPTEDGLFSYEAVECIAACGGAPALQVNLEYRERVTPADFDALLAELRRGAAAVEVAATGEAKRA